MNIRERLSSFMLDECACGKAHKIELPQIIVENGAIAYLPKLINDYTGKKVLQQLILEDDGYILGVLNTDEKDLARRAKISVSSYQTGFEPKNVVNGISRAEENAVNAWRSNGIGEQGEWIEFSFEKEQEVSRVQLTFDSGFGKAIKITLSDNRRKQQSKYLPEELVKDFSVLLIRGGQIVAQKEALDNTQRLCRVEFEKTLCDSVKILFKTTHGCKEIRVFEVRIK